MQQFKPGSLGLLPTGVGSMVHGQGEEECHLCKKGRLRIATQDIAFRQWTDKGYVHCRVTAPVRICDQCGSRSWGEETEALIEEALRRDYEKLK